MNGLAWVLVVTSVPTQALDLEAVLASTRQHYPKIFAAEQKIEEARGKLLANRGEFDLKLGAGAKQNALGFYEKAEAEVSLEQGLEFGGIDLQGGYRYGDRDVAPYDGGQVTSDRGEGFLEAVIPLWKDRAIDGRRLGVRLSEVAVELRGLDRSLTVLQVLGKATTTYWKWVSTGQKLEIAQRLLDLAETRQKAVKRQVEQGSAPEILLQDNMRLIVSRRVSLVSAERDLQQAAVALSLFLRNRDGMPVVPTDRELPEDFPEPSSVQGMPVDSHVSNLRMTRPDLRFFDGILDQIGIEREFASNLGAPTIDVLLKASQDAGEQVFYGPSSDPNSSEVSQNEAEVGIGLKFSLPLQRRKGRGETLRTSAALRRVEAEYTLATQEAVVELRQAYIELDAAVRQVSFAREAYRLSLRLEEAERRKFELGQSNLLFVNQRESQAAGDANKVVTALQRYQVALAFYRVARGVWDADLN